MKKRVFVILIILAVFLSPPFALFRSMAVMLPYSSWHKSRSVQAEKGFEIDIPGGMSTAESDWYPFVMTFNDDAGFRNYTGNDSASLTIMYNFPAFSLLKGCSRLFDPSSQYRGAFYGAYITSGNGEPYGFCGGAPDADKIAGIPEFDLKYLVLGPFGLDPEDMIFDKSLISSQDGVSYAGYDGWSRFDVGIKTNSPVHKFSRFDQSYLQYGIPAFESEDDFAPTDMYGRIYAKYFDKSSTGVIFYILAADPAVIADCDREILSKSVIKGNI